MKFNSPVLLNLLGNIFLYCPAVAAIQRINIESIYCISLLLSQYRFSNAFIILEFGVLQLRHRIVAKRVIFHHHILTRGNHELIKKVYLKQQENSLMGDWFQTLSFSFSFIGEEIDDQKVSNLSKYQYRIYIPRKIKKPYFSIY